jgi:hypothetical protein
MIVRIYLHLKEYDTNYFQTIQSTYTKYIRRLEGGWWFTEEIESSPDTNLEKRNAYEVIDRILFENNQDTNQNMNQDMNQNMNLEHTTVIEILNRLPDDFIQTPCWEEAGPSQVWKQIVQHDRSSLEILQQVQDSEPQLLVRLQYELEEQLSPIVFQHLDKLHTSLRSKLQVIQSKFDSSFYTSSSNRLYVREKQFDESMCLDSNNTLCASSTQSNTATIAHKNIQSGLLCKPSMLSENNLSRLSSSKKQKSYNHTIKTYTESACMINMDA